MCQSNVGELVITPSGSSWTWSLPPTYSITMLLPVASCTM